MPELSKRLLILACSRRKRSDPELLPALERYDGPTFRVVRKFLRDSPDRAEALDIAVLSAEFGLISADQRMPDYDRRMTAPRAYELRSDTLAALKQKLAPGGYRELFISAPRDYLQALIGCEQFVCRDLVLTISSGTQGRKLTELRDWLHGGRPLPTSSSAGAARRGTARIRGVVITLTPAQVLDIARQALAEGRGNPDVYQSWYVEVDGRRVGAKWLVSVVTGLAVSSFVTTEAHSVLARLGCEVHRI